MGGINAASFNTTDNKQLFSVGQKYAKIDDNQKPIFEDLDLNNDKQLSQNEIDAFYDYLKKKDENNIKHQKLAEIKRKANTPWYTGGITGLIAGTAGVIAGNKAIKGIYDMTNGADNWFNKTFIKKTLIDHFAKFSGKNACEGDWLYSEIKLSGTPIAKALLAAGGILLAGAAGYGIYKYFSNKAFVKESQKEADKLAAELDKDDAQIRKLDEQYKHLNIQEETLQKIKEQKQGDFTWDDAMKTITITNLMLMMMDDDMKRRKDAEG